MPDAAGGGTDLGRTRSMMAPSDHGWLAAFFAFCQQPGVGEGALLLLVVGSCWWLWARWTRLAHSLHARAAVQDFLFGVEQALHGDHHGARDRLAATLKQDPENHVARLLLANAHAALGELAEANLHHVVLARGFQLGSAANEVLFAQCLLAAGQQDRAAQALLHAMRTWPTQPVDAKFAFQTLLRGGERQAAVQAGQRWLAQDPANAPTALRDVLARLRAEQPAVAENQAVRMTQGWQCQVCTAEARFPVPVCPLCGAQESHLPQEPALCRSLDEPDACADAIEQNDAHLQRLAAEALRAPAPLRCAAFRALLAHPSRAATTLLAGAWLDEAAHHAGTSELLVALGTCAVEPLLRSYLESGWVERLSGGLLNRRTQRRLRIIQVLTRIGDRQANQALAALASAERDNELLKHLQRGLQQLRNQGGQGDG